MARQSTTPVKFNKTTRKDSSVLMSSARAGVVVPAGYIPLLPGDSASGRVGIDIQLKEMPKPVLNAVHANVQAWVVAKSAHPKFTGREELQHAFTGKAIKALGAPDRAPPAYFTLLNSAAFDAAVVSPMFKILGLHAVSNVPLNTDLIDAFQLVYNFRLAAHSSRLPRRLYAAEGIVQATSLPPAFWPSSRFSRVVPDYERALVVGALDLDVAAGRLPVSGIGISPVNAATSPGPREYMSYEGAKTAGAHWRVGENITGTEIIVEKAATGLRTKIFAEMGGQSVTTSLADIDKSRTTQAFARLRTAYAGNDTTGFDNDDTLVSMLMQGLPVAEDDFKRPWLLDSKRVPVGFAERFATDAANLDQSVTLGRASAVLSLNVPALPEGGVIVFTIEILPERVDERMSDEWLQAGGVDALPNALRDVQRTEPVDLVLNRRIDAKHAAPNQIYGYEPMNDKWNRDTTRLGGDFYMATPGGGWTENRSAIWQSEIVNPNFTGTHYLAPAPFPHDVFADTTADAFEFVCRHTVAITGLTQIGDVLVEANGDYEAVQSLLD